LNEAIVDIEQREFAPKIFATNGDKPSLLPNVRHEILQHAANYAQWGKIHNILLIGSILTKRWKPDSDIDVTVIMEPFSEESFKAARQYSADHQDTELLTGTEHPVNVFIRDDWDDSLADQIYYVLEDDWYKQTIVKPLEINKYLDAFERYVSAIDLEKAELKRDLIDYDELAQFAPEDVKGLQSQVQAKLDEINDSVKKLAATYKTIHALRNIAFRAEMSPEEIRQFQIKNKLPANVVYKLLQRYHYTRFLTAINKALESAGGAIDTDQDVDDVEQAFDVESAFKHITNNEVSVDDIEKVLDEITTSAAAGSYEVPLGARPQARRRKRKKKLKGILTYENLQNKRG